MEWTQSQRGELGRMAAIVAAVDIIEKRQVGNSLVWSFFLCCP